VIDSKRQLVGLVIDKDTRNILEQSDHITLEYLYLIDIILILPKILLKNKYRRKITVINTIVTYCGVEENALSCFIPRKRLFKDKQKANDLFHMSWKPVFNTI
jgi:hypothetical protein